MHNEGARSPLFIKRQSVAIPQVLNFRTVAFVTVFCTLMLPVEVRILPTYEMAANLFGPLQGLWDLLH